MQLKDYYKILRVKPNATHRQVKTSFRQLAHLYHPDKNPGNALAEANFKEIQEAYETLADPQRREEYNYKRRYSRAARDKFLEEILIPEDILRECRRLHDYLLTVNVLRIEYDGLSRHIRQLLNETNTSILLQENNVNINGQIIEIIMQSAALLPFKYIEQIVRLLRRVAGSNQSLLQKIRLFEQQQRNKNTWQKYRVLLVVIVTLLICLVIYRVSR